MSITKDQGYTKHGKEADECAEKMARQEVLACQTHLVEWVLSKESGEEMFSFDDVQNLYRSTCPECGEDAEENQEHDEDYSCSYCDWRGDDPESEPREIFEWWLVTPYLADKLEEQGEVTIREFGDWWGRICTGQAIVLDGTLQDIVASTGYGGFKDKDQKRKGEEGSEIWSPNYLLHHDEFIQRTRGGHNV